MAERRIGQLSFTDELVVDAARANLTLQRVSELVDWSAVEALLSDLRSGTMGLRPIRRWRCSRRCCCSNGTGSPILGSRKLSSIACRFGIFWAYR